MKYENIDLKKEGHWLRDCTETGITKALLPFSIESEIPAHRQDIEDVCDGGDWEDQIVIFNLQKRALPSSIVLQGKKILHVEGYEMWCLDKK